MTHHEAPETPQDAQEGAERPFSYSASATPVETSTDATAPAGVADSMSVRERLAEYAHEAWSGWMKYMFEHGGQIWLGIDAYPTRSWIMGSEKYDRWRRQMNTPYADLPESEKESDRAEADKILRILET